MALVTKRIPRLTAPHLKSLATALAPILAGANAGSFIVDYQDGDVIIEQGSFSGVSNTAISNAVAAAPDWNAPQATTQRFTDKSREKDVLADAAARVRSRDVTAWGAMNLTQKKTATLAEADAWVAIRQFIEDNL